MLTSASSATQVVTQTIERQAYQIQSYQNNIVGFAQQIKYSLLGAVGVLGLFGTGLNAIQRSAAAEELQTSFGTLLQNMEAGEVLVRQLQQLAAQTPLETTTLSQATKTLLQFNAVAAGEVVPTLRMIGDSVSGQSDALLRMSYAFGQVAATGRLTGQDLMQMINAGFNPLQEISRTSGKGMAQLKDEMEKGLISFDMVKEAFRTATSEGGRFYRGMELGSKTLSGLFSTLKDDVGLTLQDIGDTLVRVFDLKEVVRRLSDFAQQVRKWINVSADGFIYAKQAVVEFVNENYELIMTGVKTAGVISGLWLAIKATGVAIGIVSFALRVLKIDVILSTALWLGWKLVVLAWGATILLVTGFVAGFKLVFSAAMAVAAFAQTAFNIALGTGELLVAAVMGTLGVYAAGAIPGYTLGTIVATGATWLFNAALTVMNALLAPANLLLAGAAIAAIVVTLGAAAVPLAAIAAAIVAAWEAGKSLLDTLQRTGDMLSATLEDTLPMLLMWRNIIEDITRAVQVDFGLAWRMAGAYARLAVAQVSALWPPVWQFIQTGFTILWDEVTNKFKVTFYTTLIDMLDRFMGWAKDIAAGYLSALTSPLEFLTGGADDQIKAATERLQEGITKAGDVAGKHWELRMKEAVNALTRGLNNMDLEAIKAAQAEINKIRGEVRDKEEQKAREAAERTAKDKALLDSLGKTGSQSMKNVEKAAHHAHQAVEKVRASLATGPEGYSRLVEYANFLRDRFEDPNLRGRGYLGRSVISTGMGAPDKTEAILTKIERNTAKEANANPVMLYSAGI
jgi:tape measure domain-containing protein